MKIAQRIGILILLTVCFLAIEKSSATQAKTTDCPEEDQCFDQAYAAYNTCVVSANDGYNECEYTANIGFDSCRSAADEEVARCEARYNRFADYSYGQCFEEHGIPLLEDWWSLVNCFVDADQTLEDNIQSCNQTHNDSLNICHSERAARSAVCNFDFYERTNICTSDRNGKWLECEEICP